MNEARFSSTKRAFAMTCGVQIGIGASSATIWSILTDAAGYGRWNSTVERLEGVVREGETLKIHVPGTARVFTPKVTGVVVGERMTWADGIAGVFKGVRQFELTPRPDGSTDFAMSERFSGAMLPLVGRLLPDFKPIFEAYAGDLREEAEAREPRQLKAGGVR